MTQAIIAAGGKGSRMQGTVNKLLMLLDRKPVLAYSLEQFNASDFIDHIHIVAHPDDITEVESLLKDNKYPKVSAVIPGGEKRQDSVYNGIKAIKADRDEIIVVHNGANPFADQNIIGKVVLAAEQHGAAAAGFPANDSIKIAEEHGFVQKTIPRNNLWHMQTPQAAKSYLLTEAYVKAYNDNYYGTDDMELIERLERTWKLVECGRENFKITYPHDLENAKLILGADRVGLGQDSHRFDANKKLVLGGMFIPNEAGLEANSDGDVILHSLFNALSLSVGGKSLGFYADPLCAQGIRDSSVYLTIALDMAREKGFAINNISVMLECKKPRLEKFEELIKRNISRICKIAQEQVGLAVTSGEGLTAWGKGEGIQCFCIVLLKKI